ncbi:zinc finger protein 830 [Anopheles bellator]|uniref:zinc finger protein 830 n=1 Tax=Anopheles bellator TaxID=139047 RepID=UPI0026499DAA|nr:zinc finger protein 830 [Anopheles bellator]
MSAMFKQAKKKYSQQDLRRIMSETKAKQLQQPQSAAKRIESPLARYNDAGQLSCVLCKSVVRSEAVWKVHINSKQHKENVQSAKKLKEDPLRTVAPPIGSGVLTSRESHLKRSAAPVIGPEIAPPKKLKGILKTSANSDVQPDGALPDDFFDASTTGGVSSIRRELVNIRLPEKHRDQKVEPMEHDGAEPSAIGVALPTDEEKLPEGFFDDPKMDAKARNQEYKDPNDEEWDRFQKEIKEATNVSLAIISEEQEESTAERQIAEIDEQIRNWSRVLDLEKKKERAKTLKDGRTRGNPNGTGLSHRNKPLIDGDDNDDDDDDEEFEEFLDWRSKKSYK